MKSNNFVSVIGLICLLSSTTFAMSNNNLVSVQCIVHDCDGGKYFVVPPECIESFSNGDWIVTKGSLAAEMFNNLDVGDEFTSDPRCKLYGGWLEKMKYY